MESNNKEINEPKAIGDIFVGRETEINHVNTILESPEDRIKRVNDFLHKHNAQDEINTWDLAWFCAHYIVTTLSYLGLDLKESKEVVYTLAKVHYFNFKEAGILEIDQHRNNTILQNTINAKLDIKPKERPE